MSRQEARLAWWLITPSLVVILGIVIYPLLQSLFMSLHDWNLTMPEHPFVGLRNYWVVLTTASFWRSIGRTLYFTIVSTGLEVVLGLGIALLLNRSFRGRGALRALVLLPWALPTVVNGIMWRWIDNPDYGALNALLTQTGLLHAYQNWLGSPMSALNMVILADVWKMTPLAALLLLAGLQTIPRELYESAAIDGAGSWRQFTRITLPLLRTSILIVLVARTIEAFKVFDIIYIMTRGGPGDGTMTIAYYAYTQAFSSLLFGKGAAISYLIALFIMLLSIGYVRLLRPTAE